MGKALDLLPKTLIAALAQGTSETEWVDGRAIANWRTGWLSLEKEGLVEIYRDIDAFDGLKDDDMIVRLTKTGAQIARRSIQSDKVLEHVAQEERAEKAKNYMSDHPMFGLI